MNQKLCDWSPRSLGFNKPSRGLLSIFQSSIHGFYPSMFSARNNWATVFCKNLALASLELKMPLLPWAAGSLHSASSSWIQNETTAIMNVKLVHLVKNTAKSTNRLCLQDFQMQPFVSIKCLFLSYFHFLLNYDEMVLERNCEKSHLRMAHLWFIKFIFM